METIRTPVFHRYTVIEKIGSGGMGTVYKAHDKHLDRLVALKVLPPALQEDDGALERFNREARALAHLNHPRVAAVFDAHTEGGFPHLVMELVEGENLERLLKTRRALSVAETVRIGTDVADALAHIHSHRIVHRDVKTSNIIMEPLKGAVLADFGIALEASLPRLSQGALGTPEYMSPEQADGRDLDGRSDLYSLGVVLFECLAGRPPFRRDGDSLASLMDLMHRVTTEAVPPLDLLCPDVPSRLCAVVMQCLEKDPHDRFTTAAELADALREDASDWDADGASPSTSSRSRPDGEQRIYGRRTARGDSGSNVRRRLQVSRRESGRRERTRFRRETSQETTVLTHVEPVQTIAFGPNGRLASGSNDGIVRLWDAGEGRLLHHLRCHRGSVSAVAFSRDGRFVASGDRLGKICLWDGGTGRLLREIDALSALVLALVFSPDGKVLVSGGADRAVRLWNVRSGKLADTIGRHQGYVLSASFSGDGSRLATCGSDGQVLIWDVGRSALTTAIQGHRGWAMAADLSANGQHVVSGGADRRIRIWKAMNGVLLHEIEAHHDAVMAAAISPSGRFAVSAGRDGRVRLWDARSGELAGHLGTHAGALTSVSFSPDGRHVAAASDDRTVRVWNLDRRSFGPSRPVKRVIAWAAIAIVALASLYGPVNVTNVDVEANWTRLARSAGELFGWTGSDRVPSHPSPSASGQDANLADAGPSPSASGQDANLADAGASPSNRESASDPGPSGSSAAEKSTGKEPSASHRGSRGPGEDAGTRAAEGGKEGDAGEAARPRAAGPPQVVHSDPDPSVPADRTPANFHPLYGGGVLLSGIAGWTIEVGRLRSLRGALWLVEQYRDMGYRADVLDLDGRAEQFLVGVGHFEDRGEAEATVRRLRGRDLPFRIRATRLVWDQMVAER